MTSTFPYPEIQFQPTGLRTIDQVLDQIDAFERGIGYQPLNLRPSYQRGDAWNVDFQEKLVYSLITNYPIGNFIFRRVDPALNNNASLEVVDGQQRLLTIRHLVRGGMELSPAESRHILSENGRYFDYDEVNNTNPHAVREYAKYKNNEKANIKLKFQSLPSLIQRQILSYSLSVIEVTCSDEAIAQYFRYIQNQERLRAGEIINSIPDTPLRKYLDMVEDKNTFLAKVRWNESRKEFDKIFYGTIGVLDDQIYFGTTDNNIINYVSNGRDIPGDKQAMVSRMVASINAVTHSAAQNRYKFSKRLVKYFLLTSALGVVDYVANPVDAFNQMCLVESKLPVFNSGSTERIQEAFAGVPEETVENYRNLFYLGRGSHSPAETKRLIRLVGDLVNS